MPVSGGIGREWLDFWRNAYLNHFVGQVSTAASTPVFNANPRRVALIMSSGVTDRYIVNFGEPAVLDSGFTQPTNMQITVLTIEQLGVDITKAVFATGSSATLRTISIYELIRNDT